MTSTWIRACVAAGATALAILLLGINQAFEAAGSIPDIEGCGFLAGSIPALALLYPVAAGIIARSLSRRLHKRFPMRILRTRLFGAITGLCGACIYLGLGLLLSFTRPVSSPISPEALVISVFLMLLCAAGGYIGARRSALITSELAWRRDKS
jgi:hypothetical protein